MKYDKLLQTKSFDIPDAISC